MKTPTEWIELLQRCQNGEATCMYVYNAIEDEKREQAKLLAKLALELCYEIEKFPASDHQTSTSIKASDLHSAIVGHPGWLYRQSHQ